MMNGEPEIVKKLILEDTTSSWVGKRVDMFNLVEGVMSASFKVLHKHSYCKGNWKSCTCSLGIFWWIILLCAYTKSIGDLNLSKSDSCQKGMEEWGLSRLTHSQLLL